MGVPKSGLFWHVHHDILVEYCYNYGERAEYIRTVKPKDEREIRLRLFQPIKGSLPQETIEAGRAYDKAGRAYDKARQAYKKALTENVPAIKALHEKECPNCPWDGKTIFPIL